MSAMKLVTFETATDAGLGPRVGVMTADESAVIDIHAALGATARRAGHPVDAAALQRRLGADMIGLIERQNEALPALRALLTGSERPSAAGVDPALADLPPSEAGLSTQHPIAAVRLCSPIPRPVSLRDGYAFRQHVESARRNRGLPMIPEFDHFPIFYYSNHLSVIGPGPVNVRQGHLDKLDFELEAAVVLGRGGRDLDITAADDAIFGLMVMNDWSARGLQMEEMKLNLGPAKGKDFATALGPYLVPKEDLAASQRHTPRGVHYQLAMHTFVNGTQVAAGNLGDMHWTFAEILARVSYGVTVYPGEVIGSGTVGTGCFLETNGSKIFDNWWLKPGDVVDCEVAELGRLRNTVVLSEPGAEARP